MRVGDADRAVIALARRQHGVVAWWQLLAAGLSADAVAHRVAKGWLVRVHRGVYLVGPLRAPHAEAMAAVLACGDSALLSHYAAAVLWGVAPPRPGGVDVTVVGRNARKRTGLKVHRVAGLHPADRAMREQIPVTSPARTLLDLAASVPERELNRATDEARVHRLVADRSLTEQFRRYPNHRGTTALRKAIQTEPALTRSEAERRLLELIRAARLPEPETNVRVGRFEVDFLWREVGLIVEVDGYAFHSSRSSFERDRRRDAQLTAQGFRIIRLTWRQITEERETVVAILATGLAARTVAAREARQRYQR